VAINTLNRQLTTRFPNNFIDRAALVANANQTAMDQADRAADVVPGSLRVDSQHLVPAVIESLRNRWPIHSLPRLVEIKFATSKASVNDRRATTQRESR
jgi:hypothetical protein